MDFYYLLLGHLLGDFTFQTNKIAKNKSNNFRWILIHSIIVTIIMLFLALPFGHNLIILVLLNGILHFFIDYYKSRQFTKNSFFAFLYFILDQAIHITIIYIISIINDDSKIIPAFSRETILLIMIVVFVISFSAIFVQYLLKLLFLSSNKDFFNKNERAIGNSIRAITFFILYISLYYQSQLIIFLPIVIIIATLLYYRDWKKWMTVRYFFIKITLDISMSIIGIALYSSLIG